MISKGYKHTELGVLPEDWEVVKLGDVGKIIGGGTPSTKKVEFWSGTIPWISSSDIDENSVFDISQTRYITQEAISKSSTKPIEPNSILIVSRVGLGKVAVNQNVLCTSQDIQALTQHKQNAFFLVYAVKNLVSLACRINQGTSIKGFTKEVLSNLCIPLPPLAEQERIAEILSTWDTQIQNFESLITEKQNLKKGLCQTLLTAKTRLKGFSEDWEVARLGEIAEIKTGDSNREDSTESGGAYTFFDRSQDIRTSNRYLFDCEAIIVGGEGSDFVPKYFEGKFDLHQRSYAITKAKACIKYLYYFITQYRNFFLKMAVGSTVKSLRMNCFTEFPILFPPLAEQEKIAEILSEADNEITLLEQKLESLKSQKSGLMQNLLNGKVRVCQ
ncbi:restriction endonuclease subunit S [uncultured Helicobacter sp.]|uniref:restriction endonuclease subunit S n=1 Tax=uncultured Helicobacter sp. TaxID=175537 RepID=UPI00374EFFF8